MVLKRASDINFAVGPRPAVPMIAIETLCEDSILLLIVMHDMMIRMTTNGE
jgi:hypothetical protein